MPLEKVQILLFSFQLWLGSSTLVWQLIKEKENYEFKPVKNTPRVAYCSCGRVAIYIYIYIYICKHTDIHRDIDAQYVFCRLLVRKICWGIYFIVRIYLSGSIHRAAGIRVLNYFNCNILIHFGSHQKRSMLFWSLSAFGPRTLLACPTAKFVPVHNHSL